MFVIRLFFTLKLVKSQNITVTLFNPYTKLKDSKVVKFQSIANEKVSIISVSVYQFMVIIRLNKVRHEENIHMPPSIPTQPIL